MDAGTAVHPLYLGSASRLKGVLHTTGAACSADLKCVFRPTTMFDLRATTLPLVQQASAGSPDAAIDLRPTLL